MRVVLSGTSNSIIAGGFRTAFEEDPSVSYFSNASYGASGTVAIGDHLRRIDFSQYDFCLIDYCVNEEMFRMDGLSSPEDGLKNVCAMVDAASSAGCQPVLVFFPFLSALQARRPFEDALLRRLVARGVRVFDGNLLIAALMQSFGYSAEALFLDARHVRREIGRFIGESIIKSLQRLYQMGLPQIRQTDLTYPPLKFIGIDALTVPDPRLEVTRVTRLLKVTLLKAQVGSILTMSTPDDGELVGVTYNLARAIGGLRNRANGASVTEVTLTQFFRKDRKMTLVCMPTILTPATRRKNVMLDIVFEGHTTKDQPDPCFELLGFVWRASGRAYPVHIAAHFNEPALLNQVITDSDLNDLKAQLSQ